MGLVIRGDLGEQDDRLDGVFVADEITYQVAVALFVADDKRMRARTLEFVDFFSDELKAREHVDHRQSMPLGDLPPEFGGDDRLPHGAVFGERPQRRPLGHEAIEHERPQRIAVQQNKHAGRGLPEAENTIDLRPFLR